MIRLTAMVGGDESLNDFANTYAISYEEYNAIWEILNELKIGA